MLAIPAKPLRPAPTLTQLGARVFLLLGAAFLLLALSWLWLSWKQEEDDLRQSLRVTAALAAGQAQNYLVFISSHMEDLAATLRDVDFESDRDAVETTLERFRQRHPDLGGIGVLNAEGKMLVATPTSSRVSQLNAGTDPAWQAELADSLRTTGLSVGRPHWMVPLMKWVTPLRYTVRDSGGKVRFVVQTGLFLERQQAFWANLGLPQGSAIGLIRRDGYLISRLPAADPARLYREKHPIPDLLREMEQNVTAGFYKRMDGEEEDRFGAFHRVSGYPLYALISLPQAAHRKIWWEAVHLPLYLLLGLLTAGLGLYWELKRRFARRMESIRHSLDSTGMARGESLPSSGVREIDMLCVALAETQVRLKQAAKNQERQLLAAADAGTYSVRVRDRVMVAADHKFLQMLGLSAAEVIGKTWAELVADDTRAIGGRGVESEVLLPRVLRFRRKDDAPVWLSLAEYVELAGNEAIRHGLAIDVTQRERLLGAVQAQSRRLQVLWQLATNRSKSEEEKASLMLRLGLDALGMDTVMIGEQVGDKVIIRHAADRLGLFRPGEECRLGEFIMRGSSLYSVADLAASEEGRAHPLVCEAGIRAYASMPIRMDGQIFGTMVFLRCKPLPGGFSEDDKTFMELLAAWFGLTLTQQSQREVLETMALTDSLTGLPNRRAAEIRFGEEVARAKRDGGGFTIAICDLDRFKLINDQYGHDVGDEVLQQVAHIMRSALREGDWLARWGGEEFILFLHQSHSAEAVAGVERIRQALRAQPLQTRQGGLEVTASFGIGVFSSSDEDISRVLAEADGCLYEAKKSGRDCVVAREIASCGTLWQAGMLQQALREKRVVPAYQVIVDLASGLPVADEALARLVQPDGTIIPAKEFIEAAEGINLIHTVDSTITQQAMARCLAGLKGGWLPPGHAHFVNLSPQFLAHQGLVEALVADAQKYCGNIGFDLGPHKPIVLEITERQLLSDFNRIRQDVQPLLDLGFRLALDDFGSGYSSFLYLAELPVSFIKIEGWMVQNMRHNAKVLHLVESIVALAQTLGIITIAECIECPETAEMLRNMGVNWGQGYHFGRPEILQD